MKNHASLKHDVLRDSMKSEYKNAPLSPSSKEETWLNIQQGLKENKKKKVIFKPGLVAASILIAFIIGTLALDNSQGDAFGWITKYFQQDNGTITQIGDSISTGESNSLPLPSTDSLQEIGTITKEEVMSLSEAQKVAKFHILTPTFLPDGYELLDVNVVYGENETSNDIIINYSNQLMIQQIGGAENMGNTLLIDNEDTKVETITIKGEKATLLTFKDHTSRLIFNQLKTRVIISGSLPGEELISIAESMK
ncbi:DUF4367 domain-containing protein [Fredinandcohnia sp. QZ13]|uniref:DUF4367 domain-containing protein n=1 Tax=Fredinandcohnia sp. QZ13 TaxID=3073144 RepID=UPI0028533604|nr:DUF4367 domain-containing protein [Fredinandcohnia sp. QZ13]MDR4887407.1 DUF4367 domain-containing protein [Fredinandcohnia sp. QZ13]